MVVCLRVALRWTGDLFRVYPCLSYKGSWDSLQQTPVTLNRTKRVWIMDGWIDGFAYANLDQWSEPISFGLVAITKRSTNPSNLVALGTKHQLQPLVKAKSFK